MFCPNRRAATLQLTSVHPRKALQPFQDVASLKTRPYSSLFPARPLHSRIPETYIAYLWAVSSHLLRGFPTNFVLWNFPLTILLSTISSSTVLLLPANPSLINLICSS